MNIAKTIDQHAFDWSILPLAKDKIPGCQIAGADIVTVYAFNCLVEQIDMLCGQPIFFHQRPECLSKRAVVGQDTFRYASQTLLCCDEAKHMRDWGAEIRFLIA